jgi:hypothetical protein
MNAGDEALLAATKNTERKMAVRTPIRCTIKKSESMRCHVCKSTTVLKTSSSPTAMFYEPWQKSFTDNREGRRDALLGCEVQRRSCGSIAPWLTKSSLRRIVCGVK